MQGSYTSGALKRLHHAGAAPAHAVWKTAMRAATSMMLDYRRPQGLAEFGIAPNSPRLQRGANLSQLFSLKVVPPRGNAPWSTDYRSVALLLSYGGEKSPVKVTLPRVSDVSRAYYYYTNGRKVVTASGLSPDRTGLRIRALEMLCICGVLHTESGGAPENRTLDGFKAAAVFETVSSSMPDVLQDGYCRLQDKWLPE